VEMTKNTNWSFTPAEAPEAHTRYLHFSTRYTVLPLWSPCDQSRIYTNTSRNKIA
jgi:hypothetical protein